MKRTLLLISIGLLFGVSALAETQCFIAKENNHLLVHEGDCSSRHAPCSTFKIAISLMGFNEGLLTDETHPELPFKKGYPDYIESWKQPQNPRLWIKNSCVWYSQNLTQKMGVSKFKDYVTQFNYGNRDTSGDKGKDNGLTQSWLSSSLEISPEEQTVFLQKLLANTLPVSLKAQEMTRNILYAENLAEGWKLYGKSGSGSQLNHDRTQKLDDRQIGWYVGWIKKGNRTIIFAHYIQDKDKQDTWAGPRAKLAAKEKLLQIIQSTKKVRS